MNKKKIEIMFDIHLQDLLQPARCRSCHLPVPDESSANQFCNWQHKCRFYLLYVFGFCFGPIFALVITLFLLLASAFIIYSFDPQLYLVSIGLLCLMPFNCLLSVLWRRAQNQQMIERVQNDLLFL